MVAPSWALMSSPMIGTPAAREARRERGIAGQEDRDAIHDGDARLERALGVEPRRALRTDREIVREHVDLRVAQLRDDLFAGRLLLVRHQEATILGVALEVVGDPIEHAPHPHAHARLRDPIAEHRGAVGLFEDRLGDVLADLAQVDVERGGHLEVARAVAADLPVHQADRALGVHPAVEARALNQRARAVAHTDDRDPDLGALPPLVA